MSLNVSTPWHKASFDRFMKEHLPRLLSARLPLGGYQVKSTGQYTCSVRIVLAVGDGEVEVEFADIPQPDEDGIFEIHGIRKVVVPTASHEDLDVADISCAGEQLYTYVEERLGEGAADLPWDQALVRAWLPLRAWIDEFLQTAETADELDDLNWLARQTHLRRIRIRSRDGLVKPGHLGRVCLFETPEGTNIGRILTVALGAEVRDGKLIIVDERREAALGITASMVPLLEHSDANRLLMGVNMMRQWLVPPDPEPALVQTGNEPDAPGFWCGRNLLTAYISLGGDTFEDGIVISQSCAKRLNYPHPVEPGDKLSNRHGTKGTITRILPDDEMPHLEDGTPVEIVFSFIGCQTRLNFGQIRECVLSRIAKAEGAPVIVPPFCAPREDEIRERLGKAGLPESGMETLTLGRNGKKLQHPSAVGWVYWGKTYHVAQFKIHASVSPDGRCNGQGDLEYYALRDIGAFESILESHNTRSAEREDAARLAARVSAGTVEQAGPPTPKFADLVKRLRAGGINAEMDGSKLTFRFEQPDGPVLKLARPVPHPWQRERALAEIGAFKQIEEYQSVAAANDKVRRMMRNNAPESLIRKNLDQLEQAVKRFFEVLLQPEHLKPGGRVLFSGRAVLSVGPELRTDQLGLPEDIAWTIFGALVVRKIGDEGEVRERTDHATKVLDEIMARSWVILNRAPTLLPTSLIAFHPVRHPERVIRIHPVVCMAMNADFDGDQAAVFLPLTEAGQREAGELLSVAGHLKHDHDLLKLFCPTMEATWGLASLSLTPKGRKEISELVGTDVAAPEGFVTRESLMEALRIVLERDGVDPTLQRIEQLTRRGFEVTKESGASINPFIGASLDRPPEPASEDPEDWKAYAEECAERIASRTDFDGEDMGPQLLAIRSRARGSVRQLAWLLGSRGVVTDVHRTPVVVIRRGLRDCLNPDEAYACVVGAREGLARTAIECARYGYDLREPSAPKGFNVLSRAMRAERPGIVFARAAATGEVDPLADVDSRLFVGLSPTARE